METRLLLCISSSYGGGRSLILYGGGGVLSGVGVTGSVGEYGGGWLLSRRRRVLCCCMIFPWRQFFMAFMIQKRSRETTPIDTRVGTIGTDNVRLSLRRLSVDTMRPRTNPKTFKIFQFNWF